MPIVHMVTIQATGHRFQARPDESILAAARRAGVWLAMAGVGAARCPAQLLAGRGKLLPGGQMVDAAAGDGSLPIDLSITAAASDLHLAAREIEHPDELAPRPLRVEVVEKRLLAPDVLGLFLRPAAGEAPLHWLPGQYLEFVLDDGRRRPFSIAGNPRLDGVIELHLRQSGSSGFTAWAWEQLQVGAQLRIEGPRGTLVPREDSLRPMLFVAGGTGFAPLKAIIEYFLHQNSRRPMHLYWGVRSAEDIYLPALIDGWRQGGPALHFHACVVEPEFAGRDGLRTGLVPAVVLADHPTLDDFEVYASGPPAMIEACRAQFTAAGLPPARLYSDSFGYDPTALTTILKARGRRRLDLPPAPAAP